MESSPCPWVDGVVLVCVNERAPGAPKPSCGKVRGAELRRRLKMAARAPGNGLEGFRVLESSCLDICSAAGVAVARVPGQEVLVVDPECEIESLVARLSGEPPLRS